MRALLTAAFALAALVLSAPLSTAAPPTADPPDVLTPAGPPDPTPCTVRVIPCDIGLSTFTLPTTAPTEEPPTVPPTTTTRSPSPTTATTNTQTDAGTASGPVKSRPANPTEPARGEWVLIAVPVLALLTLAAAGAFLIIQRSERRKP